MSSLKNFKQYLWTQFPLTAPVWRYLKGRRLRKIGRKEVFREKFRQHSWGGTESVSGPGSGVIQTDDIRKQLPGLLEQLHVKIMLDAPCGDFFWMNMVELPIEYYIGADIVPELIDQNRSKYTSSHREFRVLDITEDQLPKSDLILCRDCLIHFSYDDIFRALSNFKASGAKYLLTTSFTGHDSNVDIATGLWRPINLEAAPINLPPPVMAISENKKLQWHGSTISKNLALWKLEDISIAAD